ncbi:hypothetical protein GGS21DRAFT_427051 [Xylaria nigripes]|nr:hypothetical protein GGS21DRAFT_427051 [Xylaria nigripes]
MLSYPAPRRRAIPRLVVSGRGYYYFLEDPFVASGILAIDPFITGQIQQPIHTAIQGLVQQPLIHGPVHGPVHGLIQHPVHTAISGPVLPVHTGGPPQQQAQMIVQGPIRQAAHHTAVSGPVRHPVHTTGSAQQQAHMIIQGPTRRAGHPAVSRPPRQLAGRTTGPGQQSARTAVTGPIQQPARTAVAGPIQRSVRTTALGPAQQPVRAAAAPGPVQQQAHRAASGSTNQHSHQPAQKATSQGSDLRTQALHDLYAREALPQLPLSVTELVYTPQTSTGTFARSGTTTMAGAAFEKLPTDKQAHAEFRKAMEKEAAKEQTDLLMNVFGYPIEGEMLKNLALAKKKRADENAKSFSEDDDATYVPHLKK